MSCGRLSTSLLITITSDLSTRRGYRSGSYSVLHSECVACIVVVRRSRFPGRRAAELRWLENESEETVEHDRQTRLASSRIESLDAAVDGHTPPHPTIGVGPGTVRAVQRAYAVREQTSRLNCIHRAAQLHSQGAVREQTSRSRRSTAPDASLTLWRSCR